MTHNEIGILIGLSVFLILGIIILAQHINDIENTLRDFEERIKKLEWTCRRDE
jgi:hypothetical protein